MALSFLYRLVRRALELVRVHYLGDVAKDAEIIVLRHQLAVLSRQVGRPRFSWSDRALVALLASVVPRERWRSFLVTPQTVLDWHRRLVRRHWTYPHRRPGRPRSADEAVELICRLARENPRWGYLRIVGELKKLGVAVSKTSVAAVLRRAGLRPAPRRAGPTWSEFLHAQAQVVLGKVDRWFSRRLQVGRAQSHRFPGLGAFSGSPWSLPPQRPPIEPCVRFSRTRLHDIVHREAFAAR